MMPFRYPGMEFDAFGQGGITVQLDAVLRSLLEATERDDAQLYANLVAQAVTILRPKLTPEEFARLRVAKIEFSPSGLRRSEARKEKNRLLFEACQRNLAELLDIASKRGLYAKEDKSEEVVSEDGFAIRD